MGGGWFTRRTIIILLLAFFPFPVVVWRLQGAYVRPEIVRALRENQVQGMPVGLWGKVWTAAELDSVVVRRIPRSYGKEQAISREIHAGGGTLLSAEQYDYQATIVDSQTGFHYVLGRARATGIWRYASLSPESAPEYIRQRQQEVDELRNRR